MSYVRVVIMNETPEQIIAPQEVVTEVLTAERAPSRREVLTDEADRNIASEMRAVFTQESIEAGLARK